MKQGLILLLISLIPTTIFLSLCLLTKLQLIIYLFISILYIISMIIVVHITIKNRIKKQLMEIKQIDKSFIEEDFSNKAFDIYKDVQIAWSNFKLKDVKDCISKELYDQYENKLEELKQKNQKNIMTDIEYQSNQIVYAKIEDKKEEIICEMNVICHDYIVEEPDKIVKGEKDKTYNYLVRLYFYKNPKDNKLILENKKLLKTKIIKKTS